jgi:putative protease
MVTELGDKIATLTIAQAVEQLLTRRDWARDARRATLRARIDEAVQSVSRSEAEAQVGRGAFSLTAHVYRVEDAELAADAGATEICFDPFLRHPAPPVSRIRALRDSLAARGVALRLRTPTIVRPEDRPSVQVARPRPADAHQARGLAASARRPRRGRGLRGECLQRAHRGRAVPPGAAHRRVGRAHGGRIGAARRPWDGDRFDVFLYGRPRA